MVDNKQKAGAAVLIMLLAGGLTYYITSDDYENAFYCYEQNKVGIGELRDEHTISLDGNDNVCTGPWQDLSALCGALPEGRTNVSIRITQYVCDLSTCRPSNCEVV